jgi:acyl-CoA synthetase (AMP-forming)/AMP-acid ligase II
VAPAVPGAKQMGLGAWTAPPAYVRKARTCVTRFREKSHQGAANVAAAVLSAQMAEFVVAAHAAPQARFVVVPLTAYALHQAEFASLSDQEGP